MANRLKVFNSTNGKCYYCGCNLDYYCFHIDHFMPKSIGGKGGDNLVPACPDCNLAKGSLSIEDFRDKLQNIIYETHHGRLAAKYGFVTEKPIKFYFEEMDNGVIQNNINEFLD